MNNQEGGDLTVNEAISKLQKYCAYQERSHQDVRNRLLKYKVYGDDLENVISELIQSDFLNEERFAIAYVSGKFKIKKWGRNKIIQNLKQKKVSAYCINKGLKEIDNDLYDETLLTLMHKKTASITAKNQFDKKDLVAKYLINKGYESELVWGVIERASGIIHRHSK